MYKKWVWWSCVASRRRHSDNSSESRRKTGRKTRGGRGQAESETKRGHVALCLQPPTQKSKGISVLAESKTSLKERGGANVKPFSLWHHTGKREEGATTLSVCICARIGAVFFSGWWKKYQVLFWLISPAAVVSKWVWVWVEVEKGTGQRRAQSRRLFTPAVPPVISRSQEAWSAVVTDWRAGERWLVRRMSKDVEKRNNYLCCKIVKRPCPWGWNKI